MWYKLDIIKLGFQLLPPILRSKVLVALLKAMLRGIRDLYNRFYNYRSHVLNRLNITAGVQYIEKVLNDAFFLSEHQIYIVSADQRVQTVLHFKSEGLTPVYVSGNPPLYVRAYDDVPKQPSFIVYVPSFLCTSINAAEDKYGGQNLTTILNLLNHYKPAGRSFRIEIYEYE
nr:MAG TPA: hypothetical protein [Bacteriophage sp.]